MINAKAEFLEHIEGRTPICAVIKVHDKEDYYNPKIKAILPLNYTPAQYDAFLEFLNFQYDDGYGCQELYGTIWYADGTWSERGEYDGSEWWEHIVKPSMEEVWLNEC